MAEQIISKRCPQCNQTFPATTEYFHRNKTRYDGLQGNCKQCQRQDVKQSRQTHRAERRLYNRQCYKTIRGHLRYVWYGMRRRCNNPKHEAFKYYGGRGIKIKFACFKDFYYYVVKELKSDPRGLTIDRIDNDGHYEPGNIRFISQAENNQNQGRKANPSP